MDNNILVIVGMHRSGTSLTSGWLNLCGLNVGSKLLGKTFANKKGHYEDNDFLDFHEKILKSNAKNYLVNENDVIHISDSQKKEVNNLISIKNRENQQWGWKEPRTCLFLSSIYKDLLPNAKYLFIYRPYDEVVYSLYRRLDKYQKSKNFFQILYNKTFKIRPIYNPNDLIIPFLESWIRYNQEILDFIKLIPSDNYIFFESKKLITQNDIIFETLTKKWGFNLNKYDIEKLYESNLFSEKSSGFKYPKPLLKKAEELTTALQKAETI